MTTKKPPPRFAEGTTVAVSKTQGEIRELLRRHDAGAIGVMEDVDRAQVAFTLSGRSIRLRLVVPALKDFRDDARGWTRAEGAQRAACDAELRRRWRALLMRLKVRLEEIAAGEGTVDEVFLAHLVLPGGDTVGERMAPQLSQLGAGGTR